MMFAFRHFVPYLGAAALALAISRATCCDRQPKTALQMGGTGDRIGDTPGSRLSGRGAVSPVVAGPGKQRGVRRSKGRLVTRATSSGNATQRRRYACSLGTPEQGSAATRIWTFAAGALPYEYRDAYIFEELVSFRHRCPPRNGGRSARLASMARRTPITSMRSRDMDASTGCWRPCARVK